MAKRSMIPRERIERTILLVRGHDVMLEADLRCQSGASSWGGRRYHPYAFNEQGVAMLSSVLRSKRAVQVNHVRDIPVSYYGRGGNRTG